MRACVHGVCVGEREFHGTSAALRACILSVDVVNQLFKGEACCVDRLLSALA